MKKVEKISKYDVKDIDKFVVTEEINECICLKDLI